MTDTTEADSIDAPRVTLRRLRHPLRVTVVVVVFAILMGVAFVAGPMVKAPSHEALRNATAVVPVFAAAEERVVDDGFLLPAHVNPAPEADIVVTDAPADAGDVSAPVSPAARVVLSRAVVGPGSVLAVGTLIGEVSGRPVFAWAASAPRYRDLAVGDSGDDVRALQEILASLGFYTVAVDGVFDGYTFDALAAFYSAAGLRMPFVRVGTQGFAWREFVALPAATAEVVAIAAMGAELTSDVPLLRVRSQSPTITTTATVRELDRLAAGAEVGVIVDGSAPVRSTVVAVGPFETDEETGASGYPITIAMPDGVPIPITAIVQVRLWRQTEQTLAVPAIAIRQEGPKVYVLTPDAARKDDEALERVEVVVTAQSDGWVAIEPRGPLVAGQKVLVSDGR